MSKTKTLKCVITGNETVYSGDFLSKKIQEYGTEENLEKYYVCKEVKSFLKKRYKIKDIRKVLAVKESVPLPSPETVEYLEKQYNDTLLSNTLHDITNVSEFTNNTSDKDVEQFINKYIIRQ